MRISDWSSDVCSSDLMIDVQIRAKLAGAHVGKSEADSNRRHRRGSRCRYIDRRISNIDGLGPFGLRNCGEQREWIGFSNRQRSEEHTSELQSLMRISYAVFCLKKKKTIITKQYK